MEEEITDKWDPEYRHNGTEEDGQVKKTPQEMLQEQIIHDTERKRRALAYIESRQGTCTHEEVQRKYNLAKRVIKQGGPSKLTQYGYFAGDLLVMDRWDK